jgi:hypothetical protein
MKGRIVRTVVDIARILAACALLIAPGAFLIGMELFR